MEFNEIKGLFESYVLEAAGMLESMPEIMFYLKAGVLLAMLCIICYIAFTALFG